MLDGIKIQQLVAAVCVVQSLRPPHFGLQQSLATDLPHQHAEVSVRAIQHRRHAEAVGSGFGGGHESIRTLSVDR